MLATRTSNIKTTQKHINNFICLELVSTTEQHTINTACTYFCCSILKLNCKLSSKALLHTLKYWLHSCYVSSATISVIIEESFVVWELNRKGFSSTNISPTQNLNCVTILYRSEYMMFFFKIKFQIFFRRYVFVLERLKIFK